MTNAKPDNRSDNVRKIQNNIDNTLQNINEAEDYTKAHSEELSAQEKNEILDKNERRRKSIDGLRSEIKDEASHNEYNNDLN
ncbi:small acid-soluble spore protein Tlp [Cytobacillus sp. FSL W7-1323]|uniref:small acid-soluble spore protein Tlp n=1 Tax=Cytobacillus TaxID=2675230 RepID=UPI0027843491|nr:MULTISPECIES: small acid-soluble spore protein Tlp [Cytobacillus]MDQ0186217.1 small acid-soluble spore protein (thioredoxin-like protein) [Cytobacillus kochii]MEA1855083.1 small acid-soluble spore protein Tlp [Cytobacillus sp. OWB-43]MED1604810.1 small acid-soluble spore protein Tlp [Cytobacillus kochii]